MKFFVKLAFLFGLLIFDVVPVPMACDNPQRQMTVYFVDSTQHWPSDEDSIYGTVVIKINSTLKEEQLITPTKDGYTFDYWAYDEKGEEPFNLSDKMTTTYNKPICKYCRLLYAIWTENTADA